MATKKKTTETTEVTEKTFDETTDSKINEDIALIDEDDSDKITSIVREDYTTTENDVKASDDDPITNSFTKLADTIAKAVEKKSAEPKAAPSKKPFKLGLWGYLALVVVVKGAVEITKAVADSKRPRR